MRVISHILEKFQKENMAKPYNDIAGDFCKLAQIDFSATGQNSLVNQKSFYFQADPVLDGENAVITAIEYVGPDQQEFTLNGRATTALDVLASSGSVLYISDFQRTLLSQLPVQVLSATDTVTSLPISSRNGKKTFTHFTTQKWQNCYVEFTDVSVLESNKSLLFRIYYNLR
jgi:hypothetical protein